MRKLAAGMRRSFRANIKRNRANRHYIRRTWQTVPVGDRVWSMIGATGGAFLVGAGATAAHDDRSLARALLAIALALILLLAIRAVFGWARGRH
jgi:hypothetical protein